MQSGSDLNEVDRALMNHDLLWRSVVLCVPGRQVAVLIVIACMPINYVRKQSSVCEVLVCGVSG